MILSSVSGISIQTGRELRVVTEVSMYTCWSAREFVERLRH